MQKKSTYLSGKITQVMGLRYGPDIRFHFDEQVEKTQELLTEIKKNKEEIVKSELQDYRKKGLIQNQED